MISDQPSAIGDQLARSGVSQKLTIGGAFRHPELRKRKKAPRFAAPSFVRIADSR
jgi:hypothetical protein